MGTQGIPASKVRQEHKWGEAEYRKWDHDDGRPLKQELPKRASGVPISIQNSGPEGTGMRLRP